MMDFSEARRAFKDLGKAHFAGRLSRADYRVAVLSLSVLDDEGGRWRIHPDTGRWQRLENGRWIDDDPDASAQGEAAPGDEGGYGEAQIPFEIVGALVLVISMMIAASTIAYLVLNAAR